jgi:hypothetical protein
MIQKNIQRASENEDYPLWNDAKIILNSGSVNLAFIQKLIELITQNILQYFGTYSSETIVKQ